MSDNYSLFLIKHRLFHLILSLGVQRNQLGWPVIQLRYPIQSMVISGCT